MDSRDVTAQAAFSRLWTQWGTDLWLSPLRMFSWNLFPPATGCPGNGREGSTEWVGSSPEPRGNGGKHRVGQAEAARGSRDTQALHAKHPGSAAFSKERAPLCLGQGTREREIISCVSE